jgi:hypothetical protein
MYRTDITVDRLITGPKKCRIVGQFSHGIEDENIKFGILIFNLGLVWTAIDGDVRYLLYNVHVTWGLKIKTTKYRCFLPTRIRMYRVQTDLMAY